MKYVLKMRITGTGTEAHQRHLSVIEREKSYGEIILVRRHHYVFLQVLSGKEIENSLNGSLDPQKIGFTISDLSDESVKAANESVDFGTLFLSLGFFLILASFVLLSFAASSYFDLKRKSVQTLFSLGFKNRWIAQFLILESGMISLAGCLVGSFSGYLVDIIITRALNTVWTGAVQTDTLASYFNLQSIISGLILTFLTIMVFMFIKVKRYLKELNLKKKKDYVPPFFTSQSFSVAHISCCNNCIICTLCFIQGQAGSFFLFFRNSTSYSPSYYCGDNTLSEELS